MKKIILGLFVFGFLFAGSQVKAEDLSYFPSAIVAPNVSTCPLNMPNPYALCSDGKIEPATRDANQCVTSYRCVTPQVDNGCSNGQVYGSTTGQVCPTTITTTTDLTPRISYWYGKVNQHVDITKKSEFDVSGATWQTDSDGVSGADLDKLTYCKKFYPNTTSVVEYKNELINSWHDRGSLNNYISTKMSYACVSGSIIDNGCSNGEIYSSTTGQVCPTTTNTNPVITIFNPSVGSTYTAGQTIPISWTKGAPGLTYITFYKSDSSYSTAARVTNNPDTSGSMTYTFPSNMPIGKYKVYAFNEVTVNGVTNSMNLYESNGYFNIVSSVTDNGCSYGAVYNLTTGQKCSGITTPSITVLSPNGGEVYKEGDIVRVKWTSSNLPADYRINLVFNYLDELKDEYKQSVLITKAEDKGYYDYKLPMFFQYKTSNYPLPGKNYEFTAYLFDSSLFNAPSSNAVAIGSSAHGFNDGFFTINVLNTFTPDTSCSAGEVYSSVTGKKCFKKDEVKDTGCIAGQNYSSMTGKPCALGLYKKDNTDVLNPITSSITRTLKRGIKGDDVKILQLFLNLAADGSFGPQTQAKVMEWQAAHGLTADGAFGRMSREKAGLIQ